MRVYLSPTHLEGLATLEAGLTSDLSGLTMLTGEAGTGKTTLIYSLLQRDYKRVRIAHIDDPKLSFLEIMRIVLTQLNLYSPGSTKLDYLSVLDHLLDLHGKEERIAIIVDESQVLSDDVLEELRLLSNRGQRDDRCLQLILVGQPELAERLKKPELRQLNQRISSRGVLRALNTAEGILNVECRLNAQGGKVSEIFEPGALNHLLRRSDGIPRKINMLCHNAMMATFYATDRKVSVSIAKKVAAEYHDSVSITYQRFRKRRLLMPALIGGGGVAALLLLGLLYPNLLPDWVLNRTDSYGGATEQSARPGKHRHKRGKTVEQPAGQGHPNAAAKPIAAAALTPNPVALRASLAPRAPSPAASKSAVVSTTAPVTHIATPAAVALNAGIQKPTGVPFPPQQRRQITVRSGDTLEDIAIRYLGSTDRFNELIKANPQLTDINQLTVGQVIDLPPATIPNASHDQTATTRPIPNAGGSPTATLPRGGSVE